MANRQYTPAEIESAFRKFSCKRRLNEKEYGLIEYWKSLPEQQQLAMLGALPKNVVLELQELDNARVKKDLQAAKAKVGRSGVASLTDYEYNLYMEYLGRMGPNTQQAIADPSFCAAAVQELQKFKDRIGPDKLHYTEMKCWAKLNADLDEIDRRRQQAS